MNPTRLILHHTVISSWPAVVKLHTLPKGKILHLKDGDTTLTLEAKGWKQVGYHYALQLLHGEDEASARIALHPGRHILTQGAGVLGKNKDTIHIALVGNYSRNPVPILLYNATIRLVATIATLFRISIDRVQGHRELAATECPGLLFNLDLFREQLINTKLTRIKLTR